MEINAFSSCIKKVFVVESFFLFLFLSFLLFIYFMHKFFELNYVISKIQINATKTSSLHFIPLISFAVSYFNNNFVNFFFVYFSRQ